MRALEEAGVLRTLAPYCPTLVGTLPIGLDVAGSDADLICEAQDLDAFARAVLAFGTYDGFSLHRRRHEIPSVVCRFRVGALPVEIFAQPVPVSAQRAYRHMMVERRLLALAGPDATAELRRLRELGVKTEPAFAEVLAIAGDPYARLLEMADWSDAALQQAIACGRAMRRKCPFCRIVAGDAASLVYQDPEGIAFMNLRQGNPGHMLVVPRRHIPTVFDLDGDSASALSRAVVHVAQGIRSALGVADLNVWQSNGELAGQEVPHLHVHLLPRTANDGFFEVYRPGAVPAVEQRAALDRLAIILRTGVHEAANREPRGVK